jgi:hypothetical protein
MALKKSDEWIGRGVVALFIPALFYCITYFTAYPDKAELVKYEGLVLAKESKGRTPKTWWYTLGSDKGELVVCMAGHWPVVSSFYVGEEISFLGYQVWPYIGGCDVQGMEVTFRGETHITYERYINNSEEIDERFIYLGWAVFLFGILSIPYGFQLKKSNK